MENLWGQVGTLNGAKNSLEWNGSFAFINIDLLNWSSIEETSIAQKVQVFGSDILDGSMDYSILASNQSDFKDIVIPLQNRRVGNGGQTGNCQNLGERAHIELNVGMRDDTVCSEAFELLEMRMRYLKLKGIDASYIDTSKTDRRSFSHC